MSHAISSAQYFFGLTAVSIAAIGAAIHELASHSPSVLDAPACLQQPWVKLYPMADRPNDLLCTLNTAVALVGTSPGGRLLLEYFAGLGVAAVLVTVYEGFRPSSRRSASKDGHGSTEGFGMRLGIAQLSTIALAAGQVVTAGIALPAYYALVGWSTPRNWRQHQHKVDLGDEVFFMPEEARRAVRQRYKHSVQYTANVPRSSYLYTTLVSTIVGFIIPSAVAVLAPAVCKYDALSAWQVYPFYMLVINLVLPPLLRRGFTGVTPTFGIVIIAALGTAASAKAHYSLVTAVLADATTVEDVFTLVPAPALVDKASWAAHRLFAVDFALVMFAAGSKVVLALARRTRAGWGGKFVYTLALLAAAAVVGPGGAIMAMWARAEMVALRHAREYAEAKEAKEAVVDEIHAVVKEK